MALEYSLDLQKAMETKPVQRNPTREGRAGKWWSVDASGHSSMLTASQGLAVSEKMSLSELQDLVHKDGESADLTANEKKDLIKKLEANRELKKTGMRISNCAAAQDVHTMMDRINGEVSHTFITYPGNH